MSKSLSFGLNLTKKPASSKPGPAKHRLAFGADDDIGSDDDKPNVKAQAEEITDLDDSFTATNTIESRSGRGRKSSSKANPFSQPPPPSIRSKPKADGASPHQLGDLSSALTARKHAESAEKVDPSIYDYDAAYDSFKAPTRNVGSGDAAAERKPQYREGLKKMAEVRERDRKIAEDKKVKREREAEGDEFADKEKFVTDAYRRQQEENRQLEEAERLREEAEARRNQTGGMTGFYKQLLDRDDQRLAEITKAAEDQKERQKRNPDNTGQEVVDEEIERQREEAKLAREINQKGGSVVINEEGQVVDKRQLLTGGLNIGAARKRADEAQREVDRRRDTQRGGDGRDRDRAAGRGGPNSGGGGRQAMRDRQSRMLEAQYEQTLKRSRDEEAEEIQKVEVAAKSRKTESEISSAKERYLARKKAEAEARKNGEA